MHPISLSFINSQWSCTSEAQLEDFIWESLETLFGLIPFKRQFTVEGQFCDVLAINAQRQLTIIELKNTEDRYVVSQLTRYYDAILENKPCHDEIDYSLPIQLMVIAPSFHRDNLTDKKYNRLDIQFWEFSLKQAQEHKFTFSLKNLDNKQQKQLTFHYQFVQKKIAIPEPSTKLRRIIADSPPVVRNTILEMRQQILGFHERIKEYSEGSAVMYGSSKTKNLAEIRFDSKRNNVALFLWIPYVTSGGVRLGGQKQVTARIRVWTDKKQVTDLGHTPKGLGKMVSFREFQAGTIRPLKKLLPKAYTKSHKKVLLQINPQLIDPVERFFLDEEYRAKWTKNRRFNNPHYRAALAIELDYYYKLNRQVAASSELSSFVDLALQTWLKRL